MPRPTKLSDDILNGIEELASKGLTHKAIIDILELNLDTFYKWKRKGLKALNKDPKDRSDNEHKYVQMCQSLKKGQTKCLKASLDKIQDDPSWRSAAWFLERVYPKHFAQRTEFDPEGLDKWLRSKFSQETIDVIYTAMENDHENRSEIQSDIDESGRSASELPEANRGSDVEDGYSSLSGRSTEPPQQSAAKE